MADGTDQSVDHAAAAAAAVHAPQVAEPVAAEPSEADALRARLAKYEAAERERAAADQAAREKAKAEATEVERLRMELAERDTALQARAAADAERVQAAAKKLPANLRDAVMAMPTDAALAWLDKHGNVATPTGTTRTPRPPSSPSDLSPDEAMAKLVTIIAEKKIKTDAQLRALHPNLYARAYELPEA